MTVRYGVADDGEGERPGRARPGPVARRSRWWAAPALALVLLVAGCSGYGG
ncbi:hypothetical protein FOE67_26305, partial [Streptomyces calidiresistens]|nr:hypothetical protein [Streptomyces calidiresistens]